MPRCLVDAWFRANYGRSTPLAPYHVDLTTFHHRRIEALVFSLLCCQDDFNLVADGEQPRLILIDHDGFADVSANDRAAVDECAQILRSVTDPDQP